MIKLNPVTPVRARTLRRSEGSRPAEGGGFSRHLSEGSTATAAVDPRASVGSVSALLAVQEVPDGREGRRRAARRAHELLDELESLRLALLTGRLPRDLLERLATSLPEHGDDSADPRLAAVIAEIRLRAAVELAKLERFPRDPA